MAALENLKLKPQEQREFKDKVHLCAERYLAKLRLKTKASEVDCSQAEDYGDVACVYFALGELAPAKSLMQKAKITNLQCIAQQLQQNKLVFQEKQKFIARLHKQGASIKDLNPSTSKILFEDLFAEVKSLQSSSAKDLTSLQEEICSAKIEYAEVLLSLGQTDEAAKRLNEAAVCDHANLLVEAELRLARYEAMKGDWVSAMSSTRKALKTSLKPPQSELAATVRHTYVELLKESCCAFSGRHEFDSVRQMLDEAKNDLGSDSDYNKLRAEFYALH